MKYVKIEEMKNLSVLIKPASSLCNLRCRYCFYIDESQNREEENHGIMEEEVMLKLTERIAEAMEDGGQVHISFQGGEPTVAGLAYFRSFVSAMDQYRGFDISYSIQTNGTLLNEEWARFFHDHHFLVGVSLDGYESNMNQFRYDAKHKGAYLQVIQGIDLLEKYDVEYNILTVVTEELSRHPKALLQFYKSHKFKYVQLIPCLPPLNNGDDISLKPQQYASFYIEFFRHWKKEVQKGNVISVNLFENIMAMLNGYPPYQCGMSGRCSRQTIVEANGDVYPCDFYCLDVYRLGNIMDQSLDELSKTKVAEEFIRTSACEKKICESCYFRNICHGGCRRQNICYLEDHYCAYQAVLREIVPQLMELRK